MHLSEAVEELREIKERLARIEMMLQRLLEERIEEDEPYQDEIEAITSKDDLIDLDDAKRVLLKSR